MRSISRGDTEHKKEDGVGQRKPDQAPEGPGRCGLPCRQGGELIKNAEGKDADEDVLSFLRDLPGRKYEIPADVNKEMS